MGRSPSPRPLNDNRSCIESTALLIAAIAGAVSGAIASAIAGWLAGGVEGGAALAVPAFCIVPLMAAFLLLDPLCRPWQHDRPVLAAIALGATWGLAAWLAIVAIAYSLSGAPAAGQGPLEWWVRTGDEATEVVRSRRRGGGTTDSDRQTDRLVTLTVLLLGGGGAGLRSLSED